MNAPKQDERATGLITRRRLLIGGAAGAVVAAGLLLRSRIASKLEAWTRLSEFAATPPLTPHDASRDRTRIAVGRNQSPAENLDAALDKYGPLTHLVSGDDVVIVKVSAQWWNQGMTNVAAVKRMLERLLEVDGFYGEIIVFENTHFRLADGSGLSRAWTRESERNVDVPGWTKLGDLVTHFADKPVSFVGLVDAGLSALSGDAWHDPSHEHGTYGGDGRGPIEAGDTRDGYHWDFEKTFRVKRSLVSHAQVPLTWPRFTSPRSGLVVDFRDGVMKRENGSLRPAGRKLKFINMTTANEHGETGLTACCKSAMGIVDMSAGRLGTDPRVAEYKSVHYFGKPEASWRMAGPLAHFANEVRAPDLYVTVAEWVGAVPNDASFPDDGDLADHRLEAKAAHRARTIVVGKDPVAIDSWVARNLLMPIRGRNFASYDLDSESSKITKFLRYFRQQQGWGTLDASLVDVA